MNFGHDLIRTVADDRARNVATLADHHHGHVSTGGQIANPNAGYRMLPQPYFEHTHGPHAQQLLDLRNDNCSDVAAAVSQKGYQHYATTGSQHVSGTASPQGLPVPAIQQLNSPVSPPAGNGVGAMTYGGETSVNIDRSASAGSASLKRKESDTTDQGDGAPKPRKRAMTACARCRSRKTRCDNERPKCAYCVRAGVDCRYPNEPPTISVETSMILDRLAALESFLHQQSQTLYHHPSPRAPSVPSAPPIPQTYYPSPSSLTVPAQPQITLNSIFSWPIFTQYFPDSEYAEIQDTLHPFYMEPNIPPSNPPTHAVSTDIHHLKALVKRFLQEVHTKNPILDANTLDRYTLDVAEYGALWDSKSCLVLLVCALGSAASAYEPLGDTGDEAELERQRLAQREHVEVAKSYFAAAQKRLGGVMGENTMVPVQILFLVGMYHMYTLQPLAAWKMFHAASVSLQAYISTRRLKSPEPEWSQSLEQRLFWSCLKSECDIREEVPLPDSGLSDIDYPDTFPTPPPDLEIASASNSPISTHSLSPESGKDLVTTDTQVRSWYYYLAEIALRRLLNRVQNTWYHRPNMKHSEMLEIVREFEDQLEKWYNSLPEALKFPLTPQLLTDELLQHLRSRYLRIQEMAYSPFIKAVIHDSSASSSAQMREFAERGLEYIYLVTMNGSSTSHRHHGTWYACRGHSAASLVLLAVALWNRSAEEEGHGTLRLPDGWLVGVERTEKLLDVWAGELHSLRKARDLMVRVKEVVMGEGG